MNIERERMMGMPHLDAHYIGGDDAHRLDDDAVCLFCGQMATEAHHIVPKGMGGGNRIRVLFTDHGRFVVRSPLMALCRKHHGWFHDGLLSIRWEWDSPEDMEAWESGRMLLPVPLGMGYSVHDPRLFLHGRYIVEGKAGRPFDIRRET